MKRIKTAVVGCGSISDIYMTNLTNGKFTVMAVSYTHLPAQTLMQRWLS